MTQPPASDLKRAIRLPHATAMVVGTIIGASIFVQPSVVTGRIPTLPGTALVWLVAGGLTLMGAIVTAELASTFPRSGGVYVFLRETFGAWLGFLWGWAMFWVMHSGIIAAIGMVFASYLGFLIPLGPVETRVVAISAILALSAVNYRGVKHGSDLQAAFTGVKILAIVLMVAVGFSLGGPAHEVAMAAPGAAAAGLADAGTLVQGVGSGLLGGGTIRDFMLALMAALFAFGGWHMVTYNAGETVDPRRTIPRALTWGVLLVTACYVVLNAVYFYVLPLSSVIASERVAAEAADAVIGFGGGVSMTVLVAVSAFGALAGIVLAGPRVYYAMALDGLLFRWASELHPRFRTPHRAILLQAAWASVLVSTGTYRTLFTRVVYTEWIFFGVMALGVFVLRRRTDLRRDYSVWGYPVTPAIFALAAFAIVANQVLAEPVQSLTGLGIVAAGLPVYAVWNRRRTAAGTTRPSTLRSE